MGNFFLPVFKIWAATIIIIAGILFIGFNSYQIMEANTADAFNQQQLFLVREAAQNIGERIANLEGTLRIASDIIASCPKADNTVERVFKSIVNSEQRQILALFLTDQKGTILYNYPTQAANISREPLLFKKLIEKSDAQEHLVISPIVSIGKGSQEVVSVVLGFPVATKREEQPQWVWCIPDLFEIKNKFIYPVRSGKTGYAWMIDSKGILIAHPNRSLEGKEAVEASRKGIPGFSTLRLEEIVNQKMVQGKEGVGEYITGWHMGETGLTKKLIAYAPINFGNIGWSIAVSTPYPEALEQIGASKKRLAVFLWCFIATIVLGASWLLWQERKNWQVNQQLQWSQEVFNGITDGITIIDQNYRVLMVNEAVCRWQNKPFAFFIGKPCHKIFLERDELCFGCPAKETFETGKPAFRERVSITLGGKKYYFHLYTFPLKDKDGKTVRVVEYVKDVTKERLLQTESIQNERLAVIGKMSAQVAHEIRNPLSALTLNIDLLEDEIKGYPGINTTEAKELVLTIKHELKSLYKVIDEYLQFTRLPKIKLEKGDINELLQEIIAFLKEEFSIHKVVLKTNLATHVPPAKIDYEPLRRAFINIIRNAVEAMKGGGTLDVTTRSSNPWVEVTFMDSGEGISDENLEHIFTPFFSTKAGGTGLGLSITKHIITEHKGEIVCESKPEEGTRFTIHIPQWKE